MKTKSWLDLCWQLGLASWLGFVGASEQALAQQQVTSDSTLGTTVIQNDNTFEITGGTAVGGRNLFHSFSRLDVPVGGIADFLNDPTIVNIFSRVTGGNPSDINGLIRARGKVEPWAIWLALSLKNRIRNVSSNNYGNHLEH